MTTFNVANAPKAPAYVADLWQMEENPTYIRFKFKTIESAMEMEKELKSNQDASVSASSRCENSVSVHYKERHMVPKIAKAISEAYGVELI